MKFLLVTTLLLGFVAYINATAPKNLGAYEKNLAPCPSTPNCISSTSPGETLLLLKGSDPLKTIEIFFKENYRTKVIRKDENYLHLVVSTPLFRFKDDLEFLVKKQGVEFRSASRVGYSDLGKNKERIDHLRKFLEELP